MTAGRNADKVPYLLLGPTLRNLDAAAACPCSCHPMPPSTTLHSGGSDCTCQLTEEQRAERQQEFLNLVTSFAGSDISDHDDAAIAEEAARLGVDARIEVHGAPFVITGTVDGRYFFLRERHGTYRIEIAGDDNPTEDIWHGPNHGTVIRDGSDSDFYIDGIFDPVEALRLAVTAVRDALRQASCGHERTPDSARFCPDCGTRIP